MRCFLFNTRRRQTLVVLTKWDIVCSQKKIGNTGAYKSKEKDDRTGESVIDVLRLKDFLAFAFADRTLHTAQSELY